MALAAGNRVSRARATAQDCPPETGPLFGIVVAYSAPNCDVLWDNGVLDSDIPETYLDLVTFTAAQQGWVKVTAAASAEFQGLELQRYSRQTAGAGASATYALVALSSGKYTEQPVASISAVAGR